MLLNYRTRHAAYALQILDGKKLFRLSKKGTAYECYGYTNECADESLVIFFDCDADVPFKRRTEAIRKLQRFYGLSDFYELKTSKGYHYVCLDKVSKLLYLVIAFAAVRLGINDEKFYDVGRNSNRKWTLRLTDKGNNKVTFNRIIKSEFNNAEKSLGHFLVLQMMNGMRKTPHTMRLPDNIDGMRQVVFVRYPSGYKEAEA